MEQENTRNSQNEAENSDISRRDLIRLAGSAALVAGTASAAGAAPLAGVAATIPARPAGRPAPKLSEPLPRPDDGRVGFAVVGVGKLTVNQILPALVNSQKSKLVALVSGDRAKAEHVGRDYNLTTKDIYTYDTFDQIKSNPDIKVVYVVTPNSLHKPFVDRAARARKHVLCEKPFAPNSADCRAMIATCKAAGVKLMVAYRAHYEPFNLEAIRRCRSGEYGKMIAIVADHGRPVDLQDPADQWRIKKALSGGGPLPDIGIYSLNACRYLTGQEPTEIQAMWTQPKDNPKFAEVEQSVVWTMRFPNGVLATCTTSYDYQETKRYRVLFEKGWLELDPATDYYKHNMTVERAISPRGMKVPSDVVEYNAVTEQIPISEKDQFALMMDHMSDCVLNNKTPKTPGEEGLRDIELIEAIYRAARTGQLQKV
ncbi:Gfo/Idh/MocA family oxidoreductase [bacterium]|nr:MAG: Gfo/Idh/MocA family oxidoreductase [bacterium]